jgi:2-oxoglutarate dehydrogenase E1 component
MEFATIAEMLAILRRTYCSTLGVEFMHISDPQEKAWIQERIEGPDKEITFTPEGKRAILNKLVEAEGFEKFIDVKYTGTKRFGLDGSESLIPRWSRSSSGRQPRHQRSGAWHGASRAPQRARPGDGQAAPRHLPRVQGRLLCAGHGGRLRRRQVPPRRLVDREFDGNKVHLSLTANPSHLEIVDPVVLGKARAKQDQLNDKKRMQVLPSCCTGTRLSRGRGSSPSASGFRACAAIARAARCTSSSTTRSASPPTRAMRGHRRIPPMSPR